MKAANREATREILLGSLALTKTSKIRSIYEGIAPASDGAVHTFMNPAGTETTRFSHSATWLFDPGSYNLATLPKKTALADPLFAVRDCIVPHAGRVLGKADYSRAEARWCAYIANDPVRISLYAEGIDDYKWFVAIMRWDDEARWREVPKRERDSIGKVGILSGQYKVGAKTLMDSVNAGADLHGVIIDKRAGEKMEAIWRSCFPRTVEWWSEVADEVLTRGFTRNPFGRKRVYFGRRDSEGARAAMVREAIADSPQSANAMKLNQALRTLYERHDPKLLRLLMNVHDEIVFDCRREDVARVNRIVRSTMEEPFIFDDGRTLRIPADVEFSSKSWAEMRTV